MLSVKVCPACKTTNDASAESCKACNTSLKEIDVSTIMVPGELPSLPTSVNQDFVSRLPDNTLALMIMGERKPVLLTNQGKLFIGRIGAQENRPSFDLTPYGGDRLGVSRQHAMINPTEKGYLIEDLGSTNGTWVNATRLVPYTAHMLRSGDLIRFGQLTLFVYFKKPATNTEQQTITLGFQREFIQDDSTDSFNANVLLMHLAPYLKALSDIQTIMTEMSGVPGTAVQISSISFDINNQVFEVGLLGGKQVSDWAQNHVVEWRAKFRDLMKEALKKQAEGFPPAAKQENETQPVKRDYDNLWMKIRYAQIALTQECVDQVNNDLPDQQKSVLTRRLMPHIQVITTSVLDLRAPRSK